MKKPIALSLLFFILGFLTHALLLPDILANGLTDIKDIAIPNAIPTTAQDVNSSFMNTITFDGKRFSRHALTVPTSSYVVIKNTSADTRMWLLSNNPLLTTPRGYAATEAINVRLDKRGRFVVEDKNNPQEKMVITVK